MEEASDEMLASIVVFVPTQGQAAQGVCRPRSGSCNIQDQRATSLTLTSGGALDRRSPQQQAADAGWC